MEEALKELFLKEGRSEVLLAYSPGWHEGRRLIWFQGEGSANLPRSASPLKSTT